MFRGIMLCAVALALAGCGALSDRAGETLERGKAYAERAYALLFAQSDAEAETGPTAIAGEALSAPDDAPTLPARPAFGPDGWFEWVGWLYHESGLVCPPALDAFTRSKSYAEPDAGVAAACNYYGPEFQLLRVSRVASAEVAASAFLDRAGDAAETLDDTRAMARLASGALLEMSLWSTEGARGAVAIECEYQAPRDDALIDAAERAARRAQLAFEKRDRLSGST